MAARNEPRGDVVASFCPTCGGWTMFCATSSPSSKDWASKCYIAGEIVLRFSGDCAWFDRACPQAEKPIRERTCCELADRGSEDG